MRYAESLLAAAGVDLENFEPTTEPIEIPGLFGALVVSRLLHEQTGVPYMVGVPYQIEKPCTVEPALIDPETHEIMW